MKPCRTPLTVMLFCLWTAVCIGAHCRGILAIGPLTLLSPCSIYYCPLLRSASGIFSEFLLSILLLLCSLCGDISYSHDGVSNFLICCLNLTRRGPIHTNPPRCSLDGPWVALGLSAVLCLRVASIRRLIGRFRANSGSVSFPLLSFAPNFCISTPITTPCHSENYYFGDRHSLDKMRSSYLSDIS